MNVYTTKQPVAIKLAPGKEDKSWIESHPFSGSTWGSYTLPCSPSWLGGSRECLQHWCLVHILPGWKDTALQVPSFAETCLLREFRRTATTTFLLRWSVYINIGILEIFFFNEYVFFLIVFCHTCTLKQWDA